MLILLRCTALFFGILPGLVMATSLQQALQQPDNVLIVRHALAPGVGDPDGFVLSDCATQRNLSAAGREQARQLGQRLRQLGVARARVYSSNWCRCLETARLLDFGEPERLEALDSFFAAQYRDQQQPRMQAWSEHLAAPWQDALRIYISHQVNITALLGRYPASGEAYLVRVSAAAAPEIIAVITDAPGVD